MTGNSEVMAGTDPRRHGAEVRFGEAGVVNGVTSQFVRCFRAAAKYANDCGKLYV
jgi:hypothetical protein